MPPSARRRSTSSANVMRYAGHLAGECCSGKGLGVCYSEEEKQKQKKRGKARILPGYYQGTTGISPVYHLSTTKIPLGCDLYMYSIPVSWSTVVLHM